MRRLQVSEGQTDLTAIANADPGGQWRIVSNRFRVVARAVEISRSESKSLFSSERTTALHLRLQRLQALQLQRLQDGLVGLRSWMRPLLLLKLQPLRTKELVLPLLQFLKHHKIVRDFTTRQVAAPLSPPLLKKIHPELVRDCEQRPWRARPPRMWVDFVPAPTLTVRGGEL